MGKYLFPVLVTTMEKPRPEAIPRTRSIDYPNPKSRDFSFPAAIVISTTLFPGGDTYPRHG
jgi:hypothetical protein